MIYIGLFAPLIGFLSLMACGRRLGRLGTGILASAVVCFSFICFAWLTSRYAQDNQELTLFRWIPVAGIHADFTLHIDSLALLMTLIITGVGFLIHVYSIGYMDHEEDYVRYFACLNFFIFAMLLLVLAGNLPLLFVGWEGVGLASYLLIGFWYKLPAAATAATKAFVVNRIGDCGFLVGLLYLFYLFGTGNISEINRQAASSGDLTLVTLLLFIGAVGKSAQIPLHTWLPDAMAGPTPVSALIHAATMVTAGVYLVVRMHPLFEQAPMTLQVIGAVGGATALFAALCALGQSDLKKVLAYSTVSQLGFMFLACGVGAFYAAMFHLTTHAFIKALLFLSAGNVVHMTHGITDMRKLGGLAKTFTKTHWFFLLGVLSLSGIPPLAAFFSKDLILEEERDFGKQILFYVGLAASMLTAVYLIRAYVMTFLGKEQTKAKEAPAVMLVPIGILAVLAAFGGFLGFSFGRPSILERFLREEGIDVLGGPLGVEFLYAPETLIAVAGAVSGIAFGAYIFKRYTPSWPILSRAFYVDEMYDTLFVKPLRGVANFVSGILEPKVFAGSMRAAGSGAQEIAYWMQKVQSGQIRSYVALIVLGMGIILISFLIGAE